MLTGPTGIAEYIASGSRQASRCRYEQLEAKVAPVMTSRKPAPCAVTGPRASSLLTVISIPGCASRLGFGEPHRHHVPGGSQGLARSHDPSPSRGPRYSLRGPVQ